MKGSMFSLHPSLYGLHKLRQNQGHSWWILTLRGMETSFQPSTNECMAKPIQYCKVKYSKNKNKKKSQLGNSSDFLVNHHLSRTQWNCPQPASSPLYGGKWLLLTALPSWSIRHERDHSDWSVQDSFLWPLSSKNTSKDISLQARK